MSLTTAPNEADKSHHRDQGTEFIFPKRQTIYHLRGNVSA